MYEGGSFMKIYIHNIGIIEDSTLDLSGLTVIAGRNNSGKTTVGKILYSLVDSVSDLHKKFEFDRKRYVLDKIKELKNRLFILDMCFSGANETFEERYRSIFWLLRNEFNDNDFNGEGFLRDLLKELRNLNVDEFPYFNTKVFKLVKDEKNVKELKSSFEKIIDYGISSIDGYLESIEIGSDLNIYKKEIINQTLNVEFSNQIQTLKCRNEKSSIRLYDKDINYFEVDLIEDKVCNEMPYISVPYNRIYFIDDPFILDELHTYTQKQNINCDSVLSSERIKKHSEKLKFIIRDKGVMNVFEQTILNQRLQPLQQEINDVVPGEFLFTNDGEYYVQDDQKISISNLATGAKIFSIIKLLLQKGLIDNDTVLILDEPEAHLHPEWQNKLAEIIVLIVKCIGANVLLTTHSSNFMLAVDAFMRKHNIMDKVNFYQTQSGTNGLVKYECVNDDLGKIYGDYLKYLSEVKLLRDEFILDI